MRMRNFIFSENFLSKCITASLLTFSSSYMIAQEMYRFNCEDYISTDENRAPQSVFDYDSIANTFSIEASGDFNIAFKMDPETDGNYYIDNDKEWFLVEATGISAEKSKSNIWYFNGINNPGCQPDMVQTNSNGNTLLMWNFRTNTALNQAINFSNSSIIITSNGTGFCQTMGLTSTTNKSTINNIQYYATYEIPVHYPILMSAMGYTAKSLTAEIKQKLEEKVAQAEELIEKSVEFEGKTVLQNEVNKAKDTVSGLGETDYNVAYESINSLIKAIDTFNQSVYSYSYEKISNGIHAMVNDIHVYVTLHDDEIVHVYKSHDNEPKKESISVIKDASDLVSCNVEDDGEIVTISNDKINVLYHLKTGQVEVLRSDMTPVIKEKENGTRFVLFSENEDDRYQITTTFQLDDEESIFGLGQIQNGDFNQRGKSIYMEQHNRNVCIPYFQSSKNYALFWDNYSPTRFSDNENGTSFRSTGTAVDYYILCGDNSGEVLSHMRELTGECPMPALWNFGLYQSKERYVSAQETKGVVEKYRSLGVPLDCIVQDWQYWGDNAHWNAMEFLNPSFADYEDMVKSVHDNNAKIMISIWANFGIETKPYKELAEKGQIIPGNTYPDGNVKVYNPYSEEARDIYWKYLYDGIVSKGFDAYWMDSSEPDYGIQSIKDYDFQTGNGTWRSLRNAFPISHVGGVHDHHREAASANDPNVKDKRVSILTRSAFAGQQRYGANTWSADIGSTWETLANQIPAACNLSVCGIPYWNSDTGGFFPAGQQGVSDPEWQHLFTRWVQFSAFTPMMRFHGTGFPREIYQLGSAGDGVGSFDQVLKYIKIRYRMLPYLYSTAWQITQNNKTFMSGLAVAFNEDKNGYDVKDEYMFGDFMLVAPIVTENASQRSVYLPENHKWIDFWTGETHDGGQTIVKNVNADIMPLYIKSGSILPWGPDVQYSTEKKWDNLEIRVYPGEDGSFVLYEDENDGYNYENGKYTEIPFVWNEEAQTLTIGARTGSFEGMLENRTFNICKVSTRRGAGDLHETRYHATVEYNGEEIVIDLKDSELAVTSEELKGVIKNPSFEDDRSTLYKKAPSGWTVKSSASWWGVNRGEGEGDPAATDGEYIFGSWDGNKNITSEISQKVTLPQGHYRLSVDMHASARGTLSRIGNQRLFANEDIALFKDQVVTFGNSDNEPMQTFSLDFYVPEDDYEVNLGVATSGAENESWFKIDNFRLYSVDRPSVTLDENIAFVEKTDLLSDVNLYRTLQGGDVWNTFCVPFDMSSEDISENFTEIKKLNNIETDGDNIILNFTDTESVKSGTPYLVKVKSDVSSMSFADALIKTDLPEDIEIDNVKMTGTYSPVTVSADKFTLKDDAFYNGNENEDLKGYSAYVAYNNTTGEEVSKLIINIDGKPTSITEISDIEGLAKVFSISGIEVKSESNTSDALKGLPKGIYIVNGKKIIK